MKRTRIMTIISIISVAAIATISFPLTAAKAEMGHEHHGKMDMKAGVLSLEEIHAMNLPMVSESVDKAIKAVEAGDKETALAELHKTRKMLTVIEDAVGEHVKSKFANVRCPIMGTPINPEKVTKNLTREYKGQKVAFCCGGCPIAWDKLSDAEKDAKLAKAKQ